MDMNSLPRHVAIILDGNGRWAKARGLGRSEGHRAGALAVREIVTYCREIGLRHLTLYTFSSENWSRPKTEVSALFSLLLEFLKAEVPRMLQQGISLKVFGDVEGLPLAVRTALKLAVKTTAKGGAMDLNLALNYGSRAEIVRAVRRIVADGVPADQISEETIASRLYTAGQPDPDLVIRTSGEQRLSNYLLYQIAYAELYFTPVAWPDFTPAEMAKALEAYQSRSRRFGKTQEQVDAESAGA
jgi:undecaprenyl diphosphate synthase